MQYVLCEKKEKVLFITISRQNALNALNNSILVELNDVFNEIKKDRNIYSAVITGGGDKSFVAGADISEMKDLDYDQAHKFGAFGNKVFRHIEKSRVPVIAAINGYALGGGLELALACDIRIASENAIFGYPEVGLGIIPGYGGTQRLPRAIGIAQAKMMLYTAQRIDAKKALELGLVNEVTQKDELINRALSIANLIATQAPVAVANLKNAVNRGINTDIEKACKIENCFFADCFKTQDQKNVMDAFIKKEKFSKFENK